MYKFNLRITAYDKVNRKWIDYGNRIFKSNAKNNNRAFKSVKNHMIKLMPSLCSEGIEVTIEANLINQ